VSATNFFLRIRGPVPIVSDPAHSFVGNFLLTTGNAKPFKIADVSNPIPRRRQWWSSQTAMNRRYRANIAKKDHPQ
jgi:hypothetical protein